VFAPNLDSIRLLQVANQGPTIDQYGDRVGSGQFQLEPRRQQQSVDLVGAFRFPLNLTRDHKISSKSRWISQYFCQI